MQFQIVLVLVLIIHIQFYITDTIWYDISMFLPLGWFYIYQHNVHLDRGRASFVPNQRPPSRIKQDGLLPAISRAITALIGVITPVTHLFSAIHTTSRGPLCKAHRLIIYSTLSANTHCCDDGGLCTSLLPQLVLLVTDGWNGAGLSQQDVRLDLRRSPAFSKIHPIATLST